MVAQWYAVSLTVFAGSNTCVACVPYICWNGLIGKVFPEAPVSIFSRNVVLCMDPWRSYPQLCVCLVAVYSVLLDAVEAL